MIIFAGSTPAAIPEAAIPPTPGIIVWLPGEPNVEAAYINSLSVKSYSTNL